MTAADPRDVLAKQLGYALVRALQEDYAPIIEMARTLRITFPDGEPCVEALAHARPEAVDEALRTIDLAIEVLEDRQRPAMAESLEGARRVLAATLTPERAP